MRQVSRRAALGAGVLALVSVAGASAALQTQGRRGVVVAEARGGAQTAPAHRAKSAARTVEASPQALSPSRGLHFRVRLGADTGALDGRVYVIVSRSNEDEPRFQTDVVGGVPFFGKD